MADNIIEKKLGIIEVNALRGANGLMEGNTHLKSVECPFPALINGSNMFKDCINLTLFYCDDLSKLYNGYSMFRYTSISEFTTDLPSLTDGTSMFLNSGLTTFDSSLPIVSTYNDMFAGCPLITFKCKELGIYSSGKDFMTTSKLEDANHTLISFNANMPYVTTANDMFIGFTRLNNFEGDMPSLTNANNMFLESPLETFKSNNLSKLTTATSMFECNLFSSTGNGFTTFDCYELPLLDNGSRMFYNTQLSSFNTSLPKLTNGSQMFYNTQLSSFDVELPYLSIADGMFSDCDSLKSFTSDLPKLSTYSGIFMGSRLNTFDGGDIGVTDTGLDFITNSYLKESKDTLTSFKGNLTKSTNTDEMFVGFNKLDTFEGDMNEVTSSKKMFKYCEQLQTFKSNYLENLSDATEMFYYCYNLLAFDAPLPSLSKGNNMFCYTRMSEFTTDLPSLTDGSGMFCDCDNLKTFKSNLESLTTYTNMFMNTKLNTFSGGIINISDTGSSFMKNSYLSDSKDTLTTFYCNLPAIINANSMFEGYTELYRVTASMDSVTDAINMFGSIREIDDNGNIIIISQCENLEQLNCSMNSLQKGNHMLRDCPKLNENNTNLGYFYNTLVDGVAMFQGTSFTSIPWYFPNLTRSKQMFSHTNISGHLSLDMTTQFPKVSTNNGQYADPASYMFRHCPITSIDFNVSSLDNGISMFAHCTQLTQCTGAEFQEGGSYQSMFTESKFDQGSAQLIFNYAKLANVASLHIGIGFQLTEEHDFVKENSLIKYSQDNSGKQWCEGYAYCHCHNVDEAAAREYLQQHGVTKHCHANNAITHYFDENPSIMFVCNPN